MPSKEKWTWQSKQHAIAQHAECHKINIILPGRTNQEIEVLRAYIRMPTAIMHHGQTACSCFSKDAISHMFELWCLYQNNCGLYLSLVHNRVSKLYITIITDAGTISPGACPPSVIIWDPLIRLIFAERKKQKYVTNATHSKGSLPGSILFFWHDTHKIPWCFLEIHPQKPLVKKWQIWACCQTQTRMTHSHKKTVVQQWIPLIEIRL